MKQMLVEMMKYDLSLAIHSIADNKVLYPHHKKLTSMHSKKKSGKVSRTTFNASYRPK